jgi:serine/threonine-protein kinase
VTTPVASRLATALTGRYRVDRELGAGGMATVYLAHDERHGRDVAIKVLHPDLGAALGGERFLAEIRTTARLQHPHILPLLDSGDAGHGLLWYAMPFVRGETLRARLERERQLPVEDALRIAREVADALAHAHGQGVVHRDIKPENILLQDGHALVADFGIALAVQTAGGARLTQTGLSLGTPSYMSPEQAMGERTIDARSDLYALGAVTYEMLAGEAPFAGPTVQAIVAKVLSERPVALRTVRDTVPPGVEAAVLRALAKLPADRFADARAFAAALAEPGGLPATGPAAPASHPSVQAGPWRAVALGAIALAVATFGAAGWMLSRAGAGAGTAPTEYDVGLPDSAAFTGLKVVGFSQSPIGLAVSPAGDFVVYQSVRDGRSALWYRSLRDGTLRRLEGTQDGRQPAIAPDGSRVAFLRVRGREWSVEVMPLAGGTTTVLGRGNSGVALQWHTDGRLLLAEGDGTAVRWIDPVTGNATSRKISYCVLPAPIPGTDDFLCGGGVGNAAYRIPSSLDAPAPAGADIDANGKTLRRAGRDTAYVYGTDFRLVDGRYVTYMLQGDLMAASFDAASGRIGPAVRMVQGVGQSTYFSGGTYAVSASGTLVYAPGTVHAVGALVRASERGLDTLPLAPAVYQTFSLEPGGRRLAAVVEGREGYELHVHDLTNGKSALWVRQPYISSPVWSPDGGRIAFGTRDTVFVGDPDGARPPEPLFADRAWEPSGWLPGDRLLGVSWRTRQTELVRMAQRPVAIDTLLTDAVFARLSPDGRWIVYNNWDLTRLWLEPYPRTGKRWEVTAGNREEPQWLSPTEFVYTAFDPVMGFERVRLAPGAADPIAERRRWIAAPGMVGTAGPSSMPMPGGRIVYVQGSPEEPVRWFRVVPGWVERMKRVVDAADAADATGR